jgi:CheY-like chemotaxis protein
MEFGTFYLDFARFESAGKPMNSTPTPGRAAGLRVLVVDDNVDCATTCGMLLTHFGFSVKIVTEGKQCFAAIESFNPDVVLLDIQMPEISGYSLASHIRTQPQFETVVIIAVSGYADAAHVQLSLEAGCDQHLTKPLYMEELGRAIVQEVESRLKHFAPVDPCQKQSV